MTNTKKYINEIAEASKRGKLVVFVGAGISSVSGYPNWGELINVLYEKIYGQEPDRDLTNDDYLRIPQIFCEENDSKYLDEELKKIFKVNREPNELHYKILGLNPKHIITTNYDNLIEDASWINGKSYSVVAQEEDLAKAETSNYILKVHGDFNSGFNSKNIILMEKDYLTYEKKHQLITHLMKTIMATHTIVFIGYGLGDFNIKIIMSWVREMQQNDYKRPYFIRINEKKIDIHDTAYYESVGLNIIDAIELGKFKEKEYLKAYNIVLDEIHNNRRKYEFDSDVEIIEYLHDKISFIDTFKCLRKSELNLLFRNEYTFSVMGTFQKNNSLKDDYLNKYFDFRGNLIADIKKDYSHQIAKIEEFISNNNIIKKTRVLNVDAAFDIENYEFKFEYNKIHSIINKNYRGLYDRFKKAFYLVAVGEYGKAYELYTEIIIESQKNNSELIYYLSQLNRYRLYRHVSNRLNDPKAEIIKKKEFEMKNFDMNKIFNNMSHNFKDRYQFLESFSSDTFWDRDVKELFDLIRKTRKYMNNKTNVIGGLKPEEQIIIKIRDNMRFAFDNYLILINEDNIKDTLMNALSMVIEKNVREKNVDFEYFFISDINTKKKPTISFDYEMILCMLQVFRIEDFRLIESIDDLSIFISDYDVEIDRLYKRALESFKKELNDKNRFMFLIKEKFELLMRISKYVILSEETKLELTDFILFQIPAILMDNEMKFTNIYRLYEKNNFTNHYLKLIENFIVCEFHKREDIEYKEVGLNTNSSIKFKFIMLKINNNYISNELSRRVYECKNQKQLKYLFKFYNILDQSAKEFLISNYEVNDFNGIRDFMEIENFSVFESKIDLIKSLIERDFQNIVSNRNKGISKGGAEKNIRFIAYYRIIGLIDNIEMSQYKGLDDETDFLIDVEGFDYSKFKVFWLNRFTEKGIKELLKNKVVKENIKKILIEKINSTSEIEYARMFTKYFSND